MPRESPPVFSRKTILINASSDLIWPLITEVGRWPERYSHVSSAKLNNKFAVGEYFVCKSGGVKIVSTVQEIKENSFILWTGKAFGTEAKHSWTLSTRDNQILLETSESFDGWLVRLMPKAMQKMLDQTLEEWLATIKRLAESSLTAEHSKPQ
jgi:hypothetical protein